ncbi:hypothetical protein D3C81_2336510 [compost metagenome]
MPTISATVDKTSLPNCIERLPDQPVWALGASLLSLNGISRVSDRQSNCSPTLLQARVMLALPGSSRV